MSFGTSGHRGCSFDNSFNKNHILAMTQAICLYRKLNEIKGPLFLGFDTHARSLPAFQTALEVLAANDVQVIIAQDQEFTPTPVISHAIFNYNKNRKEGFADGILRDKLNSVRQVPFEIALKAETTIHRNLLKPYIEDLGRIIDMDVIRDSKVKIAVDPLGVRVSTIGNLSPTFTK